MELGAEYREVIAAAASELSRFHISGADPGQGGNHAVRTNIATTMPKTQKNCVHFAEIGNSKIVFTLIEKDGGVQQDFCSNVHNFDAILLRGPLG